MRYIEFERRVGNILNRVIPEVKSHTLSPPYDSIQNLGRNPVSRINYGITSPAIVDP